MDKPKKKETGDRLIIDGLHRVFWDGYNKAIEDFELYLKPKRRNKSTRWARTFYAIKSRCERKRNASYKKYGGRGIKCLITKEELKTLWFRDKADELKKASIDRIDNNGHYTFDNCRYIEHSINSTPPIKTHCSRGHARDDSNVYFWKNTHRNNPIRRVCRQCAKIYRSNYKHKKSLTLRTNAI